MVSFCCEACETSCLWHRVMCKAYRRLGAQSKQVKEMIGDGFHLIRFCLSFIGRRAIEEKAGKQWQQSEASKIMSLVGHEENVCFFFLLLFFDMICFCSFLFFFPPSYLNLKESCILKLNQS